MRLIDADAHEVFLTEQALRYNGENFTDKCMNTAYRLAIDAVHHAPTIDAAPQWISIKERMPKNEELVLAFYRGNSGHPYPMEVLDYNEKLGDWDSCDISYFKGSPFHVTHWMPLPEDPKEDADAEEA